MDWKSFKRGEFCICVEPEDALVFLEVAKEEGCLKYWEVEGYSGREDVVSWYFKQLPLSNSVYFVCRDGAMFQPTQEPYDLEAVDWALENAHDEGFNSNDFLSVMFGGLT